MKIRVYNEPKDVVFESAPGVEDVFRTAGRDTKVTVYRWAAGSDSARTPEKMTFGEAVDRGFLDTDNRTMEFAVELDDSERGKFFGKKGLVWSPKLHTYGAAENEY